MLANLGLGDIPGNVVLLIEEDMGNVKSIFVQMAVQELFHDRKKIVYISTTRSQEDVRNHISTSEQDKENNDFTILGSFNELNSLLNICKKSTDVPADANMVQNPSLSNLFTADVCIIDTFSHLFMEEDTSTIKEILNCFVTMSRKNRTTFLLLSDMGILTDRSERIIRAMADGTIQFRTEYIGSKINRYINIPKMPGTPPFNRMVPFNVTGRRIAIDTRERVG